MIRTRSKEQGVPVFEKIVHAASLVSWLTNGIGDVLRSDPAMISEAETKLTEMLKCLDFEHVFVNARFCDLQLRAIEVEVVLKPWDQDVKSFTERILLGP